MLNAKQRCIIDAKCNLNGAVVIVLSNMGKEKGGVVVKKVLVALLVCFTACSLCACATKCANEGCGKHIEKSSENENPLGKGHLCEECLEELARNLEEIEESGVLEDGETAVEYLKKFYE